MYRRISGLVICLLALTPGRAGADQIYGMFDSNLDTGTPQVYVLSIQTLAGADQNGTRQPVSSLAKQEVHVTAGAFSNLACVLSAAPGLAKGWIFHFVQNGVLTVLSTSVSDTISARSNANSTDVIPVAAGDRVALQVTPFGAPAVSSGTCTLTFR
jgi:hypothetical protein